MENLVNLAVQFRSRLVELEQIFDAVVSLKIDNSYEIVVAQNNCLIVRIGMAYWACPVSSKEYTFLTELLKNRGKMDGSDIRKCGIDSSDKAIRNILKSINRKLGDKEVPVSLSFAKWVISIEIELSK